MRCDASNWVVNWMSCASQERRSVACHTSEFPNWEPEITRIVGSLPIISGRDMIARHVESVHKRESRAPPIVPCMTVADRPSSSIINNPSIVSIVGFLYRYPESESAQGKTIVCQFLKVPSIGCWAVSREMRSSVSFCSRVIVRVEIDPFLVRPQRVSINWTRNGGETTRRT